MIEARQTCAWRHRDAELLPQPIAAVLQLLDRRTEHVLEDDLQQLTRRTIGRDDAFTETVGKERGFRSIVGREAGHDNATLCNDRTNTPILKNARKCLSR